MGIITDKRIDPAGECIRFLTLHHTYADNEPRTIAHISRDICRRYKLPEQELAELTAPLQALERELAAVLDPRPELWQEMFYPGADEENQLAWSFYIMDCSGQLERLPPLELRRRLIREMLSQDVSGLEQVEDLSSLMNLLEPLDCSMKTRWICMQAWREPMRFYEKYRTLVELTGQVLSAYESTLQPLADEAVTRAAAESEQNMDAAREELGLARDTDSLIVKPMCLDFDGVGACWDDSVPSSAAIQFVGILKGRIQELVSAYGNRAELLAEQLKVIADPRRMEVLMALKGAVCCGQDLVARLHVTPGTVSHHMSSLVDAGFVSMVKSGSRINYTLQRQKVEFFIDLLRSSLLE